jgi:hypothetical protein
MHNSIQKKKKLILVVHNSQTSVSAGKILRMGKGFTIEGVEGYDLSTLFQDGFKRKVRYS